MCARIGFVVALHFFVLGPISASAQYTGDKKKEAEITADTEINGKNLDQWIALIAQKDREKPDRSLTELAIKSVYSYGPELAQKAVPTMIAELNKHSANNPIDLSVRVNIPPAMSMILANVEKPDPRMVTDAVASMRRMLADPQLVVKFRVAQGLAQLGPMAKEARPELINFLKETNTVTWEGRHAAVVAIGNANYDPNPNAIPHQASYDALVWALNDSAYKVRLAALQALEMMRVGQSLSHKASFEKRLQKMAVEDIDPACRMRASLAIYPMLSSSADKKKRIEIVGKFLEHKDALVRMDAAQALGQLAEEARDQLPRLITALSDKDQGVRGWAVWALGSMKDKAAVPYLKVIADDAKAAQALREGAQEAIAAINGGPIPKKDDIKKRSR